MRYPMMLVSVLLAACPSAPVNPVPDADASSADARPSDLDGASVDDCTRACARLSTLGCPEALTPDGGLGCYAICAKAEATGKFSLNPHCVADAASKDAVRSCGTVRCKP